MVGKLPFRGVDQAFRAILRLRRFAALLVLFGEAFGILHHLIDIAFGKSTRSLNLDLLFLAGALVLVMVVYDSFGVIVERLTYGRPSLRETWCQKVLVSV